MSSKPGSSDQPKVHRTPRSAAFHEAGHAVMAMLLNIRFPGLKVDALDHSIGCCLFQSFLQTRTRRLVKLKASRWNRNRLENEMMFYKAGASAEVRSGGSVRAANVVCAQKDAVDLATAALPRSTAAEITAFADYLSVRTDNLMAVPEVWDQTKIVANKLMTDKEISYAEVQQLLVPKFAKKNDKIRVADLGIRTQKKIKD